MKILTHNNKVLIKNDEKIIKKNTETRIKPILDATKNSAYLFSEYLGTSVDDLISYSDTENVTDMEGMFYYCENLQTIPQLNTSNVTNMNSMFGGCTNLQTIPELDTSEVTNMGCMFSDCDNLSSLPKINFKKNIDVSYMFAYCNKLINIVIPNGMNLDSEGTFSNCENLEVITFEEGTTTTGNLTFENCYKLKEINFPSSLTTIGGYSFFNCKGLTSITIPNTVLKFEGGAFSGCDSMENITLPFVGDDISGESETHLGWIFGANNSDENEDYVPDSLKKVVVIGGNVSGDFAWCKKIVEIVLSEEAQSLNESAFWKCESLISIRIPPLITSLPFGTFEGCKSLTDVYLSSEKKVETLYSSFNAQEYSSNLGIKIHIRKELVDEYNSDSTWLKLISEGRVVIVEDYSD